MLVEPPQMNTAREDLRQMLQKAGPDANVRGNLFDDFIDNYVVECTYEARITNENILGQLRELKIDTAGLVKNVGERERAAQERLADVRLNMNAAHDRAAEVVRPVIIPRPSQLAGAGGGASSTIPVPRVVHAQPGQLSSLAGTSWINMLYLAVLLVAAGVDIATFYQVFAIVLPNIPEQVVWLGVVGFTTAALTLAHFTGQQVREHRSPHNNRRRRSVFRNAGAWLFFSVWAFLGVVAFIVRLLVTPRSSGSTEISVDGTEVTVASPSTLLPALLFLALYIATGVVAAGGAYRLHNPAARDFRVWSRQLPGAVKEAADRADDKARADELIESIDAEVKRRDKAWEDAKPRWAAYAGRLKAETRIRPILV